MSSATISLANNVENPDPSIPQPPKSAPTRRITDLINDLVKHWDMPPLLMVVDDEPEVKQVIGEVIKKLGCDVRLAKDGQEALEMFDHQLERNFQDTGATAHPFDLIFLDIKLPGMDGIRVLREIRRKWPKQPVVLISGAIDYGYPNICDSGPVGIASKPLRESDIQKALEMHNIRIPVELKRFNSCG